MAHLIDQTTGRDAIAYVGKTPWHGLGQQLTPDADIETWKIEAGMNWHIQKRPILYGVKDADGNMLPKKIDGQFAHVRSDTQECIGQGSSRFQLFQPGDALEFFRDLVTDYGMSIETAGCLKGGAQFWALARFNQSIVIDDVDRLNTYVLIATANDGSMSTSADLTSVRVVCNNTLTAAVGANGKLAKVRMTHARKLDHEEIKAELGLFDQRVSNFAIDADRLAQRKLTDKEATEYFLSLYAKLNDKGEITNERTVNSVMPKLLRAYAQGPGANLPTARGTAWGAVNAVTNYVDFSTSARSDENRFASGQLGAGLQLKQAAFDKALELAA